MKKLGEENTQFGLNYYPKQNVGVYFWIEHLLRQAQEKGVVVLTNEFVQTIKYEGKRVKSVSLGNRKESIDCDFLIWSVPPFFALKAANLTVPEANLKFRTSNIFHFTYMINRF